MSFNILQIHFGMKSQYSITKIGNPKEKHCPCDLQATLASKEVFFKKTSLFFFNVFSWLLKQMGVEVKVMLLRHNHS